MKRNALWPFVCLFLHASLSFAQDQPEPAPSTPAPAPAAPYASATPAHMWEIGLHGGHFANIGDIDFAPSLAGGFHVRRALDYIFSIRGDFMYGILNSKDGGNGNIVNYSTKWLSGAAQCVISINNMKWDKPTRKWNLYALVGLGVNKFDVNYDKIGILGEQHYDSDITAQMEGGFGAAIHVSKRFNIGLEHKAMIVFGGSADLLDAFDNENFNRTSFRDIPNYTSLRLNFNIGNSESKAEPLYWINPLDAVLTDVSEMKARPKFDLTDTDEDGVIDMIDQEPNTPENAPVDTRGIALDSDSDGVKDYQDKEPYSPPGYIIDQEGVAQKPAYVTDEQLDNAIDGKLKEYAISEKDAANGGIGGRGLADWFLPMIHFDLDEYVIRRVDYGHMSSIAYVMKSNPNMKVAVTGFTDQTASEEYNNMLSYNRAKSAIEFLVKSHNIPRERLILTYNGEKNNLVPSAGANFMNRRVEFKVASTEQEMPIPAVPASEKKKFKGNKSDGY